MALSVHVICQNHEQGRIIPRMARALRDRLGWTLSASVEPCDVLYLSGYFEAGRLKPWPDVPIAAYFTHKEEEPRGNAKARLFDATAERVQLRIVTARMYGEMVERHGPTAQVPAPLERERFTLAQRTPHKTPVIGLSGFTYVNKRKGEDLVKDLVGSPLGQQLEWRASGRGWPVPTKQYCWEEMAGFYQSLDVLVVTSRVEGIPMPPLEALACGTRIVVPRNVGLLDELGDVAGIYRYEKGNLKSLLQALERAAYPDEPVEPEALREVTAPYSVEAWVEDHARAFEDTFGAVDAGLGDEPTAAIEPVPWLAEPVAPIAQHTQSKRGIYCVAFGEPARKVCTRMMQSAKKYMPDIPICLCAASPIGVEDVFIQQPDSDIGGRRAKLKAYELSPAEWDAVLYLDADTEVVAPIYRYFEWIEDGWEFVICKDPHLMDTMKAFERRNNQAEMAYTAGQIHTMNTLQWNGGVWAFGRNERIARFFGRWQAEWERFAQRDQGALVRAMYADPLRIWVLGNEWNTFEQYSQGITTAGLMHYPGDARRWNGLIPGRIDSAAAWQAVEVYERKHRR